MTARCFLMLQGPCSPFFAKLGDQLRADGHRVEKLNFSTGDLAYWGRRRARLYRGAAGELSGYLSEHQAELGASDQILFGDCRPLHAQALAWAMRNGIRSHVFEEGYFRPHWITLERCGVNGRSLLPRDPDWFRDVGRRLTARNDFVPFSAPFRDRAWHDVMYHVAGALNPLLFARYRTHAPVTAPVEYAGYIRRFAKLKRIREHEQLRVEQIVQSDVPFFLLPLQLNSDAQIREYSSFRDMGEVLQAVTESFARVAPPMTKLVIKNHPLDTGLMNYAEMVRRLEKLHSVAGRVEYLESGDLSMLLSHARGVVTVNSTVGMAALNAGCATKVLARAIYDLRGLTYQGSLDDFWRDGRPPDLELFRCFRKVVMHATQVNGGLYSRQGIDLAVRNSCSALYAERSPLEELA
jgi:capsular polysaccharide export protein